MLLTLLWDVCFNINFHGGHCGKPLMGNSKSKIKIKLLKLNRLLDSLMNFGETDNEIDQHKSISRDQLTGLVLLLVQLLSICNAASVVNDPGKWLR